jgi:hypothetical protein
MPVKELIIFKSQDVRISHQCERSFRIPYPLEKCVKQPEPIRGLGVNVPRTRNVAGHIFRAFPGIQDDRDAVGQDAPDLLSANFLRFFVDLGERSAINAAHLCIRHMRQAYYQQHG